MRPMTISHHQWGTQAVPAQALARQAMADCYQGFDLVRASMMLLQHANSHQRPGAQGTRYKLRCSAGAVGHHLHAPCRGSEVATGCCTYSRDEQGSKAQYLGASWRLQSLEQLEEGGQARVHCMLCRHMQQRAALLGVCCRAESAELECCLRLGLVSWQRLLCEQAQGRSCMDRCADCCWHQIWAL